MHCLSTSERVAGSRSSFWSHSSFLISGRSVTEILPQNGLSLRVYLSEDLLNTSVAVKTPVARIKCKQLCSLERVLLYSWIGRNGWAAVSSMLMLHIHIVLTSLGLCCTELYCAVYLSPFSVCLRRVTCVPVVWYFYILSSVCCIAWYIYETNGSCVVDCASIQGRNWGGGGLLRLLRAQSQNKGQWIPLHRFTCALRFQSRPVSQSASVTVSMAKRMRCRSLVFVNFRGGSSTFLSPPPSVGLLLYPVLPSLQWKAVVCGCPTVLIPDWLRW